MSQIFNPSGASSLAEDTQRGENLSKYPVREK